MKIFIVEDNEIIRKNLQETLQELAGANFVGHASNEADAVRWLNDAHNDWDLAIVDLFLLEGNGMGVLQACQQRTNG
ncbi:MAG: response regulator, partial [Brachymonas sp.]|nr:response regulator [Brachymonas sp.]